MNIYVHDKRRSFKSVLFEQFLKLLNIKKMFKSTENMKKALEEKAVENSKPYTIGKVKLKSSIVENTFEDMQVFTLNDQSSSKQKVILYLHGGAYMNQPLSFHWKFMDKIAQALNAKITAPIYPKLPHYNYQHTYPKLINLYKTIIASVEEPQQITIMGDSAGGNLSLGLAQYLKRQNIPQPKEIILLSGNVDMVLDHPDIPKYERVDPMLASAGFDVVRRIWAVDKTLDDPIISPIYGDFHGIARITQFIGTHEALYPDAIRFAKKLHDQGIEQQTFVYPKMNHVFVLFPIPEADDAHQKIIHIITDDAKQFYCLNR